MNYHNITYPDMNNGDGLRVVLWLSGCTHHCYNCQNPQTWDIDSGIPFDELAREELLKELDKDYISGLTLTGGDPLHESNLNGVLDIVNEIRLSLPEKSIWLYSGYYWEEIYDPYFTDQSPKWIDSYLEKCDIRKQIISKCNVVVDGRYVDSLRDVSLHWCGSTNQRVIDVQKSIQKGEIVIWES